MIGLIFAMMLNVSDVAGEPRISIMSGDDANISIVVVEWPDGVIDRYVYRNNQKNLDDMYRWMKDKEDDFEKRNHLTPF